MRQLTRRAKVTGYPLGTAGKIAEERETLGEEGDGNGQLCVFVWVSAYVCVCGSVPMDVCVGRYVCLCVGQCL